jgi:hypothetical protein
MPLFFSLLVLVHLAAEPAAGALEAAGCGSLRPGPTAVGDAIALLAPDGETRRVVAEALGSWRTCPRSGEDFPRLLEAFDTVAEATSAGATSVLEVRVERRDGRGGRCGAFRGKTITLFPAAVTSTGQRRSCGSLALNLAHEIGHALGLADSVDEPRCEGTIMAALTARNARRRSPSAEECRLAGSRWLTFAEWRPRRDAGGAPPRRERAAAGMLLAPARRAELQ